MRRFFQTIIKPFKNAWVWYLILLLVLSALVWFVGPAVWLTSAGWRLFIILIFVIAWALNALRLQRKKLRAELDASSSNLPAMVDHALLDKAIADLQGKYKKALQAVAKRNPWTLFITFKRDQLPWYLVLGSQGSGKTTMLTESGLHFPLGNDALIDMKDKPEVLAQWRFAKDAIFIDTDGSLTTFTDSESLAGKVWHELLELMAWHRIRKALNGIIVTVSMQELLAQTTQQRQQLAHCLRSRISEIEAEVGIKYPVYVQVTKTDILAGFKEFFEHFTEKERDQIWGMTLPDRGEQDVVQLFPQEFDALVTRLNDYVIPRLQEDHDVASAALVTMFSSQLASSKSPLQSFLNQVFETNHYQEKGYLRGVYFISCRQDTKPINRLLLSEAKNLGLQQGDISYNDLNNKTYFVRNIFHDVIFQEKHLMQMSTDQARKMNLHRKSSYVVVGLVLGGMVYMWSQSFILNNQKLTALNATEKNYLADYNAYYSGNSEIPPSLSALYLMRHTFDADTDASNMHWGLYQGGRFEDQINTVYLRQLQRQFVPLLQQTVEEQLQENINNPSQSYNFLRVYLMLSDPVRMDKSFVDSWMQIYWQQALPAQQVLQKTLNENLAEYVNLDKTGITPNKDLIAKVRVVLRNTSPAERVYYELQKQAVSQQVSISNQFDSDFSQVFGQAGLDQTIPLLYTKQGYDDIFKKDLDGLVEGAADSNWIIGSATKKSFTSDELASIKRHVVDMYMQNYTDAWLKLLANFRVEKFDSLQDAADVLDLLAQPTSPIKQILDQVSKNTTLEKGDANASAVAQRKGKSMGSLAPKSAASAKSLFSASGAARTGMRAAQSGMFSGDGASEETSAVGADFFTLNAIVRSSHDKPAPGAAGKAGGESAQGGSAYGAIQSALSNLDAYVQNIVTSPNPNRAAFEAATVRLDGKSSDPITKLIQVANNSPAPLKQWLTAIAQNTWAAVLLQAKGYINQAWTQSVWPAYQETLEYHYPLYISSTNDASLTDFTNFFAPGGVYDAFYQQYLKPFVNVNGGGLSMIVMDGASLPLSRFNETQIQLVNAIQQSFFSNGKQVSVQFSVRPVDLSEQAGSASLEVGGKTISYSHGPLQSTAVVWPAAFPTQRASVTVYSLTGAQQSINASGDWAWLKLLDNARIKSSYSPSTIQVAFNINGSLVIYSLQVDGKYNPFNMAMIHSVRLPSTL